MHSFSKSVTLVDALIQTLQFFRCKDIYGIGGDYVAKLADHLDPHFTLRPASNECHAGFSACGYAELSNNIAVCLVTYTVGSLPAITAAALAKSEQLPVVFLSGCPGESEFSSKEEALHHCVYGSSDPSVCTDSALRAFQALGIHSIRLEDAPNKHQRSRAWGVFFDALTHAYTQRTPVFIEIPRDLLHTPVQAIQLPPSIDDIPLQTHYTMEENDLADEIHTKLQHAKAPLVYIGDRVKSNPTLKALIHRFCKQRRIPFATNLFAKGLFDETDPLSLGLYNGVFSPAHARNYVEKQADYIIEIATGIYQQDASAALGTQSHTIDFFENKTVCKGYTPHLSELEALFKRLCSEPAEPFSPHLPPIQHHPLQPDTVISFKNLVDILDSIQAHSPQPFLYLPEIGNSFFCSFRLQTRPNPLGRSWLTNPWYAAMGTALPYARAAANLLQSAQVDALPVAILGDGGFHFQCNELVHFLRERLEVVILLMRNHVFHLGKISDGAIYHCSTPAFDAKHLAHAYHAQYALCTTHAALHHAFQQRSTQGPTLIEIPVSTAPQDQSHEITCLNLYIQAKAGDPTALRRWKELKHTIPHI